MQICGLKKSFKSILHQLILLIFNEFLQSLQLFFLQRKAPGLSSTQVQNNVLLDIKHVTSI